MKSIGLSCAARRQRTASQRDAIRIDGTRSQLTVTGRNPYLYASAEYITNARAEKLFM